MTASNARLTYKIFYGATRLAGFSVVYSFIHALKWAWGDLFGEAYDPWRRGSPQYGDKYIISVDHGEETK